MSFEQDTLTATPATRAITISGKGVMLTGVDVLAQNRVAIQLLDFIISTTTNSFDRVQVSLLESDVSLPTVYVPPAVPPVIPLQLEDIPDGFYPTNDTGAYLTDSYGNVLIFDDTPGNPLRLPGGTYPVTDDGKYVTNDNGAVIVYDE